jgi:hypothetical protein
MLDVIPFWHSLPLLIRLPLDFVFVVIILRGVVAKDITSWLEDRGFIKKREQSLVYRILDFFYFSITKETSEIRQHSPSKQAIVSFVKSHIDKFAVVARKVAIVQHYRHGHQHNDVLGCGQGNCVIFGA